MILITHDDLDGAGCAVLAAAVYRKAARIFICSYNTVEQIISGVLSEPDEILITDLSVSQEIAKKLDARGNVTLLDHHKTAAWLNRYPWAKVDSSCCGTMHLYNYLSQNHDLKKYKDFAILVNDYDLWLHKDQRSRQLNRLYSILGYQRFINRFVDDARVKFTRGEKFLLDLEEEKIREYCVGLAGYEDTDQYGNRYLFVFAERYTSELGEYLLEKHLQYAYVMIINAHQCPTKVSLRSRGDIDVAAIAREYGGGGHKAAAGFVVKEPGYHALVQGWTRNTKN